MSMDKRVSSIDVDNLPSYEAALKVLMKNEPGFSLPNVPSSDTNSPGERNLNLNQT